jgi:hypothetical protein
MGSNPKDFGREVVMFNKFFASAAVTTGMLLAASAAHATSAITDSCAVNNTACQSAFTALGNNAAVGAAQDQVNWGQFATQLGVAQNNGGIASASVQSTPANDTVKVTSADNTAFTTYIEGQGHAASGSGKNAVSATPWDGEFAAATTVLYTSSSTITLSFAVPLIGLGLDAQVFNAGGYTETLTAYNSTNQVLGTITQGGVSTGATSGITSSESTVPFVGITTNAQNNSASLASLGISYVTISTACAQVGTTAACAATSGFAIDTSVLYHYPISNTSAPTGNTPEPGTMSLLGAGLAGLGYFRRRRANKTA